MQKKKKKKKLRGQFYGFALQMDAQNIKPTDGEMGK